MHARRPASRPNFEEQIYCSIFNPLRCSSLPAFVRRLRAKAFYSRDSRCVTSVWLDATDATITGRVRTKDILANVRQTVLDAPCAQQMHDGRTLHQLESSSRVLPERGLLFSVCLVSMSLQTRSRLFIISSFSKSPSYAVYLLHQRFLTFTSKTRNGPGS